MTTEIIGYEEVEKAVAALKRDKVIAFPTETVFGLGAISTSKEAFDALVAVKDRHPDKPFTLMCSSLAMAASYAEITSPIVSVMKEFLPGELTLLLRAREYLPHWMTLGTGIVGIRVPNDKNLRDLIEQVGVPLLVPSANKADEPPALDINGVSEVFNGEIELILKGECKSKTPSTIVNFCSERPVLVRQGTISIDEIIKAYDKPAPRVVLASDHGGFNAKEKIKEHLLARAFNVIDVGTHSTASCDYTDFAYALTDKIDEGCEFGVVVCTSGEGISMAANRDKNVRCGIGYDDVAVGKMREHNNANVIAFGEKYMWIEDILRRVDIFLSEKFSDEEKHHRRVRKLFDRNAK